MKRGEFIKTLIGGTAGTVTASAQPANQQSPEQQKAITEEAAKRIQEANAKADAEYQALISQTNGDERSIREKLAQGIESIDPNSQVGKQIFGKQKASANQDVQTNFDQTVASIPSYLLSMWDAAHRAALTKVTMGARDELTSLEKAAKNSLNDFVGSISGRVPSHILVRGKLPDLDFGGFMSNVRFEDGAAKDTLLNRTSLQNMHGSGITMQKSSVTYVSVTHMTDADFKDSEINSLVVRGKLAASNLSNSKIGSMWINGAITETNLQNTDIAGIALPGDSEISHSDLSNSKIFSVNVDTDSKIHSSLMLGTTIEYINDNSRGFTTLSDRFVGVIAIGAKFQGSNMDGKLSRAITTIPQLSNELTGGGGYNQFFVRVAAEKILNDRTTQEAIRVNGTQITPDELRDLRNAAQAFDIKPQNADITRRAKAYVNQQALSRT
jgi:hypothetical protein